MAMGELLMEMARHETGGRRIRRGIVGGLACAVVFCTMYALMLPAITMEQESFCCLEEHLHTEACYSEVSADMEPELICTEEAHSHTDACLENDTYICGWTEIHEHGEACYAAAAETEPVLSCERAEHTHDLRCWSDPAADVETAADWEETMAHVERTGSWAEDVLTIAETQLGYRESTRNYEVQEDGETVKGYTRYGAWYGVPYGDWCAMFASFCLHYAGVDADLLPPESGCQRWIETLSGPEYGLYHPAGSYESKPGDLIFFDRDGDGTADHVGLVAERTAGTETEPAQIRTIEGNSSDQVQSVTYAANDATILGCGQLPEQEAATAAVMSLEQTVSSAAGTPGAKAGDLGVVSGEGIAFGLFNYSMNINKTADGTAWRPLSSYFTFRGSHLPTGSSPSAEIHVPANSINGEHDVDGFTSRHATVERTLDANGYPVLDLTRNADGTSRTDPGVSASTRSLSYLFSNSGDHAVTAYSPANTVLQKSGNHYWYNSRDNAVDYDTPNNVFRVRSYVERTASTAGYVGYGDYLPFTYTDGVTAGTNASTGVDYHVEVTDTDYWFGTTMEISFYQTRDGVLDDGEMIFRFSGDDDVWVFVDDVLVLDLGGTHGTVDGSINFATGQVLQYLSWGGANSTDAEKTGLSASGTSFPTTLRACFDAAGQTPQGGWNEDGETFADYTKHTLKFFYLERGSAVANCKIDFVLPTLPDKSLVVTKEMAADEESALRDYIEDSLSYEFRVVRADAAGNATDTLFVPAGTSYDLLENGTKIGTGTVGEDGCFSLRAGQSAQFANMLALGGGASSYVVEEIMPDDLTGQYGGVEYEVSGAGGETRQEEGPTAPFTAYQTGTLSAAESQLVTFRNKVDTAKLGILKITKQEADGAVFAGDAEFRMQVTLGGSLLPVGTPYTVQGENRAVETAGIIELKIGETAVLTEGILSGTSYEVTELGTAEGNFNASYSGVVTPSGTVNCTADGADGMFPLGSTVHITVTNADYDFSAEIPVRKQAIDNTEPASFDFRVEQVEQPNWNPIKSLPGTFIAVTGGEMADGRIVIGYQADTAGTFYYKVSERRGTDDFIYDDTFYIVEVVVENGTAAVSRILKNGSQSDTVDEIIFLNRRSTRLIVTKEVAGGVYDGEFSFTADVALNGEPFLDLPEPAADAGYAVSGSRITFRLGHGEAVTIPGIPCNAVVTVTETDAGGFTVSHSIDGETVNGNSAVVQLATSVRTVRFLNQVGYTLPETGGGGTCAYTWGGLLLVTAALMCGGNRRRRREAGR